MRLELVAATANPDKLAEIATILGDRVQLSARPEGLPDVVEDGETLADNARSKARAVCTATGRSAVADDTGLEVDALGGAPGVHSARYAGPAQRATDNVAKLLQELGDTPAEARTARFRTVAIVCHPDGTEVIASGSVEGTISRAPAGSGGFGYDPVFVPTEGDGRTFAEMTPDEKHRISHRGRAFRALLELLDG